MIDSLDEEKKRIKREVKKRTAGYLVAALGLVAGLAWNDAIKSLIEHIFPLQGSDILAKFIYAIVLTIIIVVSSMYVMRLFGEDESSS